MDKCKILFIENQKTQFETITEFLTTSENKKNGFEKKQSEVEFDIYPKMDTYDDFIDNIRVYLNNYYNRKEVKVKAENNILNFINSYALNCENNKFNFIIIDHKLVGCHNSKSGIHLAELLKIKNIYYQKLVFLSRSTPNDKQVLKDFACNASREKLHLIKNI